MKKHPAILGVNLNGAGAEACPLFACTGRWSKFACLKFSGAKTSILLSCQKSVAAQRDNAPMKIDVLFGRPALRKAALEGFLMQPDVRRNYAVRLQHISEALIACGCTRLDQQAKALGVNRSTAWTIVNTKHKLDRLSTKTTKRILANPALPSSVRSIMQRYLAERSKALARRAKRRLVPSYGTTSENK